MRVGIITLVNLSLTDVYVYINHTNPRSALHIAPMAPAEVCQHLTKVVSPLPGSHDPLFQSIHILRSPDSFTLTNSFGRNNTLIIEFDGVYYRCEIPICEKKYPIILPMIMALHPQYMSLETPCGYDVWHADNNTLSEPVKLFSEGS